MNGRPGHAGLPITLDDKPVQIWLVSFLSSSVGCLLIYLASADVKYAFYLLGVAHLIAFLPAMIYTRQRPMNIVVGSILCVLFPFWGSFVGVMCMGVAAPIVCSLIWGIVLMVALRRTTALVIMVLIGLFSNLFIFLPWSDLIAGTVLDVDQHFFNAFYAWYVLMLFGIPWIMSIKPVPERPRFSGQNTCQYCGYSLEGLPEEKICPECGTKQSEERA